MHYQLHTFLLLSLSSIAFSDATSNIEVLITASEKGDTATVQSYLAAHWSTSDINAKHKGKTALTTAAENGHLDIVRLLLDSGAKVNAKANWAVTALMKAATNGHFEIAKLLLAKKADVNALANGRITALMEAATNGHIRVVELLLASNADVHVKNKQGDTARMAANWNAHDNIMDLLQSAEDKSSL